MKKKTIKKKKKVDHFKKAEAIYNKKGQSAVFDYANKHNIDFEHCKACETESPSIKHVCLVCGQETTTEKIRSMRTGWSFVEEHYPNYHSSDEIAHNGDLQKLLDEEQEDGDCADELLQKEYGGDIYNPHIKQDYNQSMVDIYEAAIENFYEKQKLKS